MSKEIIIDGVNVAECALYLKDNGKCLRLLADDERETGCNAICDYGSLYRKEQLQRLKQEKEMKLANSQAWIESLNKYCEKLISEKEKMKQALEEIREIANDEYTANSHKFYKIEELINEVLK